jgi:hypothetical protein
MRKDQQLIERFVACFEKFDERVFFDSDPIESALAVGGPDGHGYRRWLPSKVETHPDSLQSIYAKLPARFPPLYERLVLTYRWAEVELDSFRLLANPPGPGLMALFREMTKDSFLSTHLLKSGFIPFGKGPDIDYDPVCFDLSVRKQNAEYRVVKIDNEEILCFSRLKVVSELAPTFRALVEKTIDRASRA